MKKPNQILAGLVALLSLLSYSAADTSSLTIHEGDAFTFNCCSRAKTSAVKSYVIYHPTGDVYPIFEGVVYESGRLSASISDDCEVKITKAVQEDNGIWKCDVFVHDGVHKSTSVVQQSVNITLSVPQEQGMPPIALALIVAFCCFIVLLVLIIICCWKRNKKSLENANNAENEDNDGTGISKKNYSNVKLVYFKEFKDRVEKRLMPQETENAQNNNGTEYSSQENKEQNKKDLFSAKRKEKKTEEGKAEKGHKFNLSIQFSSEI